MTDMKNNSLLDKLIEYAKSIGGGNNTTLTQHLLRRDMLFL